MDKIIYIKFGELVLKGKNRMEFSRCLFHNIKSALNSFNQISYTLNFDSIIISNFNESNEKNIIDILKKIPGINLIISSFIIKRNLENLCDFLKSFLTNIKTSFKVITKRCDKTYPINSMEFSKKIGEYVLNNFDNYYVDIKNPNFLINIEITSNSFIIYFNKIHGMGGLPLGMSGKILMLISGGIDSPVAASLLLKKGFKVDFITFISPPHTKPEALEKTKKLIQIITLDTKLEQPNLFICEFTNLQHEISHISDHSYQITIMRRYFFRIAQEIAQKYKYDAIATGESIGQVASQTIESMTTISAVLNNTIVLRPLLTYDKIEIIELAKKNNTYETSILPFDDACSLFVPKRPITKPKISVALKLESEMLMGESIYKKTLESHITKIKII